LVRSTRLWSTGFVALVSCYDAAAILPIDEGSRVDAEEHGDLASCVTPDVDVERLCAGECASGRPVLEGACGGWHCGERQPLVSDVLVLNCAQTELAEEFEIQMSASAQAEGGGSFVQATPIPSGIEPLGYRVVRFSVPFDEMLEQPRLEDTRQQWLTYSVVPAENAGLEECAKQEFTFELLACGRPEN